jgi:hypothetical protein
MRGYLELYSWFDSYLEESDHIYSLCKQLCVARYVWEDISCTRSKKHFLPSHLAPLSSVAPKDLLLVFSVLVTLAFTNVVRPESSSSLRDASFISSNVRISHVDVSLTGVQ